MAPAHDVGEVESGDTTNITTRRRTALMQAVTQQLEEALALREALGGTPENFDVASRRQGAATCRRVFVEVC